MIRTRDLLIRSQTLYPAELHSHIHLAHELSYNMGRSLSSTFLKRFIKKHRAFKVCPNKKTWRKWNSWKTADTRKFPAGILWLRLSRETDAVDVAFGISECKVSYLGAPSVMGSKPPQPREGQQGFPFQTLPHRSETTGRKAARSACKHLCNKQWSFRKIKNSLPEGWTASHAGKALYTARRGLKGGDIQGEPCSSWTSCGGPGPIEEGSRVFCYFLA